MARLFLILGLAAVAMALPYDDDFFPPKYEKTALGESIDRSTMKLLKAAYDVASDKNVVSSPLGLMMLLSLFNSGAGPATKEEITKFLGGTDFKQTSESYEELSNRFASLNPEALTVANKIYVSNQYKLQDAFSRTANKYHSEVDNLDFSKPADAAAVINKWADEKTHGNIKEPVSADMLSPDVAAALFNVIYFKGHWHVPFKAAETREKDFHANDGTVVQKPTMHLERSLYYAESPELKARLVELPYKERGFRMVVVLPDEVDGLPALLEKAATRGLLSDVFRLRPAGAEVYLDLPKFDIKSKLDFNVILPKIGVSQLFDEAAPGIVNTPVKVSKAFQEAFIKVDEEGAEAGAFTGAIAVPSSSFYVPPPPIIFNVDRPFLYALLQGENILFTGTYSH
ncbi:unnamed protein product [Chrysodeixis includens]|uniref:Serpin domain-containing protein n=1 Tax=Chrysodeixis includens TaxID=689277 RepID=A0A9P0FU31_CHRIL|nr:unnamed protein product [Chrysodeixis includens]